MFTELISGAFARYESTRKKIGFDTNTIIYIKALSDWIVIYPHGETCRITKEIDESKPYIAIELDSRLLVRLLKGPQFAHWNNAEIGSHIMFDRKPNVFERGLHLMLCWFHG